MTALEFEDIVHTAECALGPLKVLLERVSSRTWQCSVETKFVPVVTGASDGATVQGAFNSALIALRYNLQGRAGR